MEKVELNANVILGALQFGVITPDEARAFFGLGPMEKPEPAAEVTPAK
jgi:hypothetical protein